MVKVSILEGAMHANRFGRTHGVSEELKRVYYFPATSSTPECLIYERIRYKSYRFSQNEKELKEIKQMISGEKPSITEKYQVEMTEEAIKKLVSSEIKRNKAEAKFRLNIENFLHKPKIL